MVNESLTTRLARERLAAIKKYIPVRSRVREKLQQRQESQNEFNIGSEQLFRPITKLTKQAIYGDMSEEERKKKTPLLDTLEKIAIETGQTKRALETLPAEIAVATHKRQRPPQLPAITEPQDPYVTIADDDDEGATARKPEEELLQEQEQELQEKLEEIRERRENIPSKVLYKSTIDKIRAFDSLEKLADFAAKDYDKSTRDANHINKGYHDKIRGLKNWTRIVYLANIYKNAIPRRDVKYNIFHDMVKNKREGGKGYSGDGFVSNGSGLVKKSSIGNSKSFNASISCPGNVLSDISRLEVLVGGKRAGNNSPEIINEAADICRRLFTGGVMDIDVYRTLIEELADGYYSD